MKKQDAVSYFGGVKALASKLGISRQAVHKWGETVPVPRDYQIEVLSNGALKAGPDLQKSA